MTGECIARLIVAGISEPDAWALRRIAMTLQRWFELECGDSNEWGAWSIERDENGDGHPFMVHHSHMGPNYRVTRTRIADRETGARKRLAKIMEGYPKLAAYVQTDPRGASLYILRPGDVPEGARVETCYFNGVAVYK